MSQDPADPRLTDDFFRNLLGLVNDRVWALSLDGQRMLYMNEAAESIYGLAREQLQARDHLWLGAVHPEDKPRIREQLAELPRVGEFEQEFRVLESDGKERWLAGRFKLLSDAQGQPVQIGVIAKDVTARVRTQEQLAETQAIYESLVQSLPLNVFRKDRHGRLVFGNQRFCQAVGRPLAEMIGKTDKDLFDPKLAEKYQRDDRYVLQTGNVFHDIEEHPSLDGTLRYVEVLKAPIRNFRGKAVGIQGIFWDVTERFLAEQQLKRSKELAEQASRAKSGFLASVSHEIRTPMNAIIGISELLLDSVRDRQQREYLAMIRQSGENLLALINDILDFSKIEAGKMELDVSSFDVRDTLSDTVRSLAVRAQSKGLELLLAFDPRLPQGLVGDLGRLRQVLINLISNAIKFTRSGDVLVRIDCAAADENSITALFAVEDTGIGIPPDKLEVIFREFEQSERTTTREFGGTGLGLAISAKLVELMGGRLQVESQLGQGSRFWFELRMPIGVPGGERTAPKSFGDAEILIVEDHPPTAAMLCQLLLSWQARPQVVTTGQAAVQELTARARQSELPRGVLIDMTLPDGDGLELAAAIRKHREFNEVGLVLMTSGQPLGAKLRKLDLERILKPIKPGDLMETLATAIGLQTTATGSQADSHAPATGKLRILLAEDNAINQQLAMGLLKKRNHHVTLVEDGAAAVEAAGKMPFDVILMDVQMPILDGIEATRRIRMAESGDRKTPVIALTAHVTEDVRQRCLEAGMNDFLTKPIRREQLFRLIDALTGHRSAAADGGSPALDRQRVVDWKHAFETVGGDRELLREIVSVFLRERPNMLRDLEQALATADTKNFRRGAHSFRGALVHLGAAPAMELAEKLEELGQAGDLNGGWNLLETFKIELEKLTSELERFKNTNG